MKTMTLILTVLLVLFSTFGFARDFPTFWGVWTWDHLEPVHVIIAPGCAAQELSEADYFGHIPTDGTVRFQLWVQEPGVDPPPPYPMANFPREDIWLDIPGANPCLAGAITDESSDSEGWVTFSRHLSMGGWKDPSEPTPIVTVMLSGLPLQDHNGHVISPDNVVNSPDINGDLVTDLLDLAEMTRLYGCECP